MRNQIKLICIILVLSTVMSCNKDTNELEFNNSLKPENPFESYKANARFGESLNVVRRINNGMDFLANKAEVYWSDMTLKIMTSYYITKDVSFNYKPL